MPQPPWTPVGRRLGASIDTMAAHAHRRVPLTTEAPIWDRMFLVAPLVLVGTREPDGRDDLAPKHMAMPLGWQNYFCFVCSPRHATHRNIEATGEFTVSFPTTAQILPASLAATAREPDGTKPSLAALETFPAERVEGVLVRDAYLWLECARERMITGFGDNSLIVGRVIAAAVDERALRTPDSDDADIIGGLPLLAYVSPGRFGQIAQSYSFPFPADFSR
jgi:flavin reductase (DIM6/NTAB) family NADH-FMN oxidoreductase RutF